MAAPEGIFWRPALPVTVQGTAGAGDSYTSTLTAALAEGLEPAEAMLQAGINAASVVGALDTTSGLLTPGQMAEREAEIGQVELLQFE